jgi:hypothetical protein
MKQGDIVKFALPLDADEAEARFLLLENPDGGRVLVQCICDPKILPIAPTTVLRVKDLVISTR